jgi:ankyrin repeat protein
MLKCFFLFALCFHAEGLAWSSEPFSEEQQTQQRFSQIKPIVVPMNPSSVSTRFMDFFSYFTFLIDPYEARNAAKKEGKIFEPCHVAQLRPGDYNYVVLASGKIVCGVVENSLEFGVKHLSLSKERPTLFGGEIRKGSSNLIRFNTSSGTFTTKHRKNMSSDEKIAFDQKLISGLEELWQESCQSSCLVQPSNLQFRRIPPFISEMGIICENPYFRETNWYLCKNLASEIYDRPRAEARGLPDPPFLQMLQGVRSGTLDWIHAIQQDWSTLGNWARLLIVAANYGYADLMEALLNKGAFVDIQNEDGETPLYIAASEGHLDAVKLLIKRGASLDLAEKKGATPLMIATYRAPLAIVQALLDAKPELELQDKGGSYPLMIAVLRGDIEVIHILLDAGASPNGPKNGQITPLFIAVKEGNIEAAKTLLAANADVNILQKDGLSPLDLAIMKENFQMTEILLNAGAT